MPQGKRSVELTQQVKDAFNTLILNESFLSDEEQQLELLARLKEYSRRTFSEVDRRLARDEEELESIPH